MISVIVPVYKVEPYLKQCLDSIVNQTYRDLEILLIDDCSPDQCGAICDEYAKRDDRIRVFHIPENRGLSAARNIGLNNAKGEYIGFVDSDDWIESDMYEVLLKALEDNEADIAVCGFWIERRHTVLKQFDSRIYQGVSVRNALLDGSINNNVWNKVYRTSLFDDVLFPERKNYEDVASMHLVVEKASILSSLSVPKYHYRIRENSISRTMSARNLMDYADAYLSRYIYYRNELPSVFIENEDKLLRGCARGILKVWRWWYCCSKNERETNKDELQSLSRFSKDHFSPFMKGKFPVYFRVSVIFLKSSNTISLAIMHICNRLIIMTESLHL